MAGSCNGTHTSGLSIFCGSFALWMLLLIVSVMLVFSLCWNICSCVSKFCSENGEIILPKFRRSLNVREMEDNPIYGNITYIQTEVDPPISSSSVRGHPSIEFDVQSIDQDFYANLDLKAPKPQIGGGSPKIQYSDVDTLLGPMETEKAAADNIDTVSTLSDLYASVQTKCIKLLDSGDGYANHI
ncbi:uncharacterized protein ACJ7VT_011251 [Polymixia lowei]